MTMRRVLAFSLISLAGLAGVGDAAAEVRVRTNVHGEYDAVQVLVLGSRGSRGSTRVWSAFGRGAGRFALNPDGDRRGDGWPTVVESAQAPYLPWVVWSRYNGTDYDLVWSRWTSGSWTPIRWVGERSDLPGDDIDADFGFDEQGRPYLAWWAEEGGEGKVYFSFFLVSRWLEAMPLSVSGVDSRNPTVDVVGPGYVKVRYDTPDGPIERTVKLTSIDSITDDVNPLGTELIHVSWPMPVSPEE
jgi:hypothetical protein